MEDEKRIDHVPIASRLPYLLCEDFKDRMRKYGEHLAISRKHSGTGGYLQLANSGAWRFLTSLVSNVDQYH